MRWLILLATVVLTGCNGAESSESPGPGNRLSVVATAYPLASIARQVGGERVDVTWWVESGQSLADYQPTPEQVERMRRAVVILTNGRTEAVHTDQFSGTFGDQRVIRLDRYTEYDASDAQLWLNTNLVKKAASELAERLAALDPAHAPGYRDRCEALRAQLDALAEEGRTQLAPLAGRVVASVGKDYSALGKQMGFAIEPLSRRPAVALEEAELSRLPEHFRSAGARFVLIEADTPPGVVQQLNQRFAAPMVTIDSLGTSAATGRDDYHKIMRFNYEQLATGASARH